MAASASAIGGVRPAIDAVRRRPTLAAAVLYAALALVFFGQALVPGRTLSNSDLLYFDAPWQASRPPDLLRPSQIGEAHDWALSHEPFLRYERAALPEFRSGTPT